MAKTAKTPAFVLQSLLDEYQITAFSLAKSTHLNYQTVRNILKGKGNIAVPTALKLGKYFGQSPSYWLDLQNELEINKLSQDNKFNSMLQSIPKAKKPAAKTKTAEKPISAKGKAKTLSEKRKKAAKTPGSTGQRPAQKPLRPEFSFPVHC